MSDVQRRDVIERRAESRRGNKYKVADPEHNFAVASERSKKIWRAYSDEQRTLIKQRISDALRGKPRPNTRGKRPWNWHGKIARYPQEFRAKRPVILERDGYACVMCGKGSRLVVHHIDNDSLNNDICNLATLCHSCNIRAESKKNRDNWPTVLRLYTESLQPERN